MKGLPANIDLAPFSDTELIQICLASAQVQLHFSNRNSVFVESAIIIRGPHGETRVNDYGQVASLLASLLDVRLLGAFREEDGGLLLRFEGDRDIRLLNDNVSVESFQLCIGGQIFVA